MRIGIPREIKPLEGRVALIPAACAELVAHGHDVFIEHDAGRPSGYADQDYRAAGVTVCDSAAALYGGAELIVKVKEPTGGDLDHLQARHRLFCYLHLAAIPELARRLLDIGLTAIAYETVRVGGKLPLLAPMSEIAGRLAVQIGAHLLHRPQGGRGILLGGLAAAERGHVVIVGAGVAGGASAQVASALGANVTVFDRQPEKLERMRALGPNVTALYGFRHDIETALADADLLIGAVLLPGQRTPHVISRATVATMKPGSVLVDISVDQGGCVETTRPTTYADPTYVEEDVLHFAVTNMPGAVPRTASQVLSGSLIPYLLRLAEPDWEADDALASGVNIRAGKVVDPVIRAALD